MPADVFSTFQPFCHEIWGAKYRFNNEADQLATNARVVEAVCRNKSIEMIKQTLDVMNKAMFVPGGRILAGAGTDRRVTLINCYVMDTVKDSLDDIFRVLRESALTMQQGGGIGVDFSTLRPRGAQLRQLDAEASGPLPFMDTWDAMCKTIMSAGARRGAMMATLRCDHPDILDFIKAKREAGRLTQFNVSVLVTDAFMEAVRLNVPWQLKFDVPPYHGQGKLGPTTWPIVMARELWNEIIKNTYEHAEPGVIFIDRVNALNNLAYCETISATNPCGEQPLPPYGDCCLGAINLARMVKDPWTSTAGLDIDAIIQAVNVGVRFLDNVLDVTNYPLEEQRREALSKRRIGLGVMGLASLLQQVGLRYGSPEAVRLTSSIFEAIAATAYQVSAQLATERGIFPLYDPKILESPNLLRLPDYVRRAISRHGLRNGVLLTVAPTGTTAIFAGNVSSGIEPVYAHRYRRAVLQPDGSRKESEVYDWGWLEWCRHIGMNPSENLTNIRMPPGLVTHADLNVDDHLAMQAAAQASVDAAISKTVNCPSEMTLVEFERVYEKAYVLGCKSCTTYRPHEKSVRGAVLTASDSTVKVEAATIGQPSDEGLKLSSEQLKPTEAKVAPVTRPTALPGVTYKVKPGEHAYYVTITDLDGRPHELFIATKEAQFTDWLTALGRMVSAIWRRGGDVDFVAEELCQIHAARGGFWDNGTYRPSLVAAIGDVIRRHVKIGNEQLTETFGPLTPRPMEHTGICPKCQGMALIHVEGCATCKDCGWSNCA